MALTVCPLSNLELCVVNDLTSHPLKKMLDLGLKATVNSDDPSYFGGYMTENFSKITAALNLDTDDLIQLTRNAIDASFISPAEKQNLHQRFDHFVQNFGSSNQANISPAIT